MPDSYFPRRPLLQNRLPYFLNDALAQNRWNLRLPQYINQQQPLPDFGRGVALPEGQTPPDIQPYKASDLWSNVESRLRDMIENPTPYYVDPRNEREEKANQLWEALHAPNVLASRIRTKEANEIRREAATARSEEKKEARQIRAYEHAVKQYDAAFTAYNKAVTDTKGAYSDEHVDALRERVNATARSVHVAAKDLELPGAEETYPTLATTGRPEYIEQRIQADKAERIRKSQMGDVGGAVAMAEMGLPNIFNAPPVVQLAVLDEKLKGHPKEAEIRAKAKQEKDPEKRAALVMDEMGINTLVNEPTSTPGQSEGGTMPTMQLPGEETPMTPEDHSQWGAEIPESNILQRLASALPIKAEETTWREMEKKRRAGKETRGAYPYTPLLQRYREHLKTIEGE